MVRRTAGIKSVRFLIPASLSLRGVGDGKHFPGGGEVTEDLVKWVLKHGQTNLLLLLFTYILRPFEIKVESQTHTSIT